MNLPARCDVAIVGSGITGVSAAIPLARAGRSVLVLEMGALGQGASTRNAGFVGRTLKHRFSKLIETVGLEQAIRTYREMQAAFESVATIIKEESIDCGFAVRGRFIPAPSQRIMNPWRASSRRKRAISVWSSTWCRKRSSIESWAASAIMAVP